MTCEEVTVTAFEVLMLPTSSRLEALAMIPPMIGSDVVLPSESRERSVIDEVASPPPTVALEMALKTLSANGDPGDGVPPKLALAGKPGEVGNLAWARKLSLGSTPGKPEGGQQAPDARRRCRRDSTAALNESTTGPPATFTRENGTSSSMRF